MPIEDVAQAASHLLGFADDIEVVAPEELRTALLEHAERVAALYCPSRRSESRPAELSIMQMPHDEDRLGPRSAAMKMKSVAVPQMLRRDRLEHCLQSRQLDQHLPAVVIGWKEQLDAQITHGDLVDRSELGDGREQAHLAMRRLDAHVGEQTAGWSSG